MSLVRTCIYCGKGYKSKNGLDKHFVLCEITHRVITRRREEIEEEELPSQRQMYNIILDLTMKYNELLEKVETMSVFVDVKKKKLNVREWLNANMVPQEYFDKLFAQRIQVMETDITCITSSNNTFYEALHLIFERTIYSTREEQQSCLFALTQKANCIYIYNTNDEWEELTREKLIYFLNIVHYNFVLALSAWNKKNVETKSQAESELLADIYGHATIKIMSVDFKKESTLSKIKASIYDNIKKDMKSLIQYEFEF